MKGRVIFLQVEQVERGLKQAEVDGRRKAEEVQAVKNKVLAFTFLLPPFCSFCLLFRKGKIPSTRLVLRKMKHSSGLVSLNKLGCTIISDN